MGWGRFAALGWHIQHLVAIARAERDAGHGGDVGGLEQPIKPSGGQKRITQALGELEQGAVAGDDGGAQVSQLASGSNLAVSKTTLAPKAAPNLALALANVGWIAKNGA